MPWWDVYFDELYLRMHEAILTPERTAQEVAGVMTLMRLPRRGRLLDLCCGQGRHAVPLARAGYRVTGLDLSAYMLERAQEAAAEAEVKAEWVQGDMRHLPWRERFDACINLFTSFGYFDDEEDNQQVLVQAYRALKPGGVLFLDTSNRDYYLLRLLPKAWRSCGEAIVLEETDFDPVTCRFTATFTWVEGSQRQSLSHSVRHYTAPELLAMLHAAGFSSMDIYGDFDGSEFDIYTRRLIVLAHKS